MPARTVLVIDDVDVIRDAVRMTLEDAGYAVLEAPNGIEGMDLLLGSDEPLVVLLDLMMPRMGGVEFLRIIQEEPEVVARHAYILFSAVSAFTALSPLRHILPGKQLFELPKPFDLDHLVAVVEEAARQLDSKGADESDDESDHLSDHDEEQELVAEPAPAPAPAPRTDGTSGGTC